MAVDFVLQPSYIPYNPDARIELTRDWKNQRDDNPEGTEPVTVRLPKAIRRRIKEIAEAENTTVTAIHRYMGEKFIADYDAQSTPGSLFD